MFAVAFLTQISWGTITKLRCPICSQKDLLSRNLASIIPATHLLKATSSPAAYLFLNFIYCTIFIIKYDCLKYKVNLAIGKPASELDFLANEWLVQWSQGFEAVNCFASQIVPRRGLIVPHEMSVRKSRCERLVANCEFTIFKQICFTNYNICKYITFLIHLLLQIGTFLLVAGR